MRKLILFLMVLNSVALEAGRISTLSPFMSSAVSSINSKSSSVMNGYIQKMGNLKAKATSNKDLYQTRKELIKQLYNQNKLIEVKIKNLDFINSLNKLIESKRSLSNEH